MPQYVTVARPYAKAIFASARDMELLAQWSQVLTVLAIIAEHSVIINLVDDPKFSSDQLADIFISLSTEVVPDAVAALGERLSNVIFLLMEHKRLAALPDVADLYYQLLSEHEGVMDISVTSAFVLDKAQQQNIQKVLEKRFSSKVSIQFDEDSSLIGGAVIRTQKEVMDGSIKGKLDRLYNSLNS
jgi:F-type H+-transporting ATPase subunit delta